LIKILVIIPRANKKKAVAKIENKPAKIRETISLRCISLPRQMKIPLDSVLPKLKDETH
jgi:hypothetical protein